MGCVYSTSKTTTINDEIREIEHATIYKNNKLDQSMHGINLTSRKHSIPGLYSPRPWHKREKMST